ncbi:MAG: alanine--tRNA ligase [Clostridia bacterium]|nr:alanine--tRNA ligase [Clostridia bacterium]
MYIKGVLFLRANELRSLYLKFFKEKGHAVIPSASIIPENDPTVLFTTAGMHPLVPYLLGAKHPEGKRLTNVQKCIRTGDIEEVGNDTHCTFFEMLGNWSLGDYFKEEAIKWSWEFLTSEKGLGIPKEKLYVTVFEGDEDAPKDMESYEHWRGLGVAEDHIFFLPKEHNWWGPAGLTGPCGPDTEMFIDTGKEKCSKDCSPACSCGKYVEIWNDVFMEYNKTADGKFEPLSQKNVDTGMGLDRTIAVLQGVDSVYDTDLYQGIMDKISELAHFEYRKDQETTRSYRIVADHIRTATFILGDEKAISPSNVDQGYVLRRLIRRAIRFSLKIGIPEGMLAKVAEAVVDQYKDAYPELSKNKATIIEELRLEEERFQRTIKQGLREFDKLINRLKGDDKTISGEKAFRLYDTFGFPIEFTQELAEEKGYQVDIEGFEQSFKKHQEKSKAGASQKFKGGLADNTEETAKLHTATHLLQAALRQVLGDEVTQRGSNITAERLRFDFTFSRKVTREELDKVESLVNEVIEKDYEVICQEMSIEEAKKSGALGFFDSKYGNRVKVYSIGDFSKELCGGPHVSHTGQLGKFKIKKEESSSAGVRRIRAVLSQ